MPVNGASSNGKLNTKDLVSALVAAGGREHLAAERIGGGIKGTDVLEALIDRDAPPNEQFRAMHIASVYKVLKHVEAVVLGTLDELSPGEMVRFYSSLSSAFANLVSKPLEAAEEQPVDISTARRSLMSRVEGYISREDELRAGADDAIEGTAVEVESVKARAEKYDTPAEAAS